MAKCKLRYGRVFARGPVLLAFLALYALVPPAPAQQAQGFAVERFYPSAPGSAWFVMDDLAIGGGLGGTISLSSGYASHPLNVASADGTQHLLLVSDQAFVDIGFAVTYDRYRGYLNLPIPVVVSGHSGIVGPTPFSAPAVTAGGDPDLSSDPTLGFDVRLLGKTGGPLRVGAGAQLIFPSGARSDYVTDGTYRGMLRLLLAGDAGALSYAGQLGVHLRPLNEPAVREGPAGSEFLFGVSGGKKLSAIAGWDAFIGPEVYGETAIHDFFSGRTGAEALLSTRFQKALSRRTVRLKLGVGHGLLDQFGSPQWRVVAAVEVTGQRPDRDGLTASR
jgi:hypothetical protein